MKKVSINDLKLEVKDSYTTISINGVDVEIKRYIDSKDKYSIIDMSVGSGVESFGVNEINVESLLHYWLIVKQTNLDLDVDMGEGKTLNNIMDTMDLITKSGTLFKILAEIDKDDYDHLIEECSKMVIKGDNFILSTSLSINKLAEGLSTFISVMLGEKGIVKPIKKEN